MAVKDCADRLFPYFLTQAIACFVLLHFLQAALQSGFKRVDYTSLYEHGWQNALTLVLTTIFLGIFWCLLVLWSQLFQLLGIDFFETLFSNRRFVYPVSGLVVGFGISICRSRINAVATVRQILLALFHALLPLLAAIGLLFALALAFTGLTPLLETWSAATLLAWLILLNVLFLNAVYQDGQGAAPYPKALRLPLEAALLVLPLFAGIALWALSLRVQQHGWSVDRLWGLLVLAVLSAYSVSYAAALFWRRDRGWLVALKPANVGIAIVLVLLLWAMNTPLLDLRKITVASQLARLHNGSIAAVDFDYAYFNNRLGRPGQQALKQLQASPLLADKPLVQAQIRDLLDNRGEQMKTQGPPDDELLKRAFRVAQGSPEPPTALLRRIVDDGQNRRCLLPSRPCLLAAPPLQQDGGLVWLVFQRDQNWSPAQAFVACAQHWCHVGAINSGFDTQAMEAVEQGKYSVVAPRFKQLEVNGQRRVLSDE